MAILFGETKRRFAEFFQAHHIPTQLVENVEQAVPLAIKQAPAGDVVLLSPACASWDQYESFEIRGDAFINAINEL